LDLKVQALVSFLFMFLEMVGTLILILRCVGLLIGLFQPAGISSFPRLGVGSSLGSSKYFCCLRFYFVLMYVYVFHVF